MHDEPRFPATEFLVALFRASRERIEAMNPARVAEHYGLPADWVAFCRAEELRGRR